jgi:glycosyltransferase 2 family protein
VKNKTPAQPEKTGWPSRALQMGLQYGGSGLVLYVLLRFLPKREIWNALRQLPLRLWVLVLVGYLAAHVMGAAKYRVVLNLGGAGLDSKQAARCYCAGLFGSLFLPSLIGGDILRIALALHVAQSKAAVLLGSLVDRITDFSALVILVLVGALLASGSLDPRSRKIFVVVIGLGVLASGIAACAVRLFPVERVSLRLRRKIVQLRRAGRRILRQPRAMLRALSMSLGVQLAFILLNIQLAEACGLRLGFRVWLFAWPLAKLCAAVPITQAGIGVRETALAALLLPFGAPPALAVASGFAWDAITVAGAAVGGVFALAARSLWPQANKR